MATAPGIDPIAMMAALGMGGQIGGAPIANVASAAAPAANAGMMSGIGNWLANPQNAGILAAASTFGGQLGGNPAVANLGTNMNLSTATGAQMQNFLNYLNQVNANAAQMGATAGPLGGMTPTTTATAPNGTATAPNTAPSPAPANGGMQPNFPQAPRQY